MTYCYAGQGMCVLDVIGIYISLAPCVKCTGTWCNWRGDFQRLAQNAYYWRFSA